MTTDTIAPQYTDTCGCCIRKGFPMQDALAPRLCQDCAADGCTLVLWPDGRGFFTRPKCGTRGSDYFADLMEATP